MNDNKLFWSAGADFITDGSTVTIGNLEFDFGAEFFPKFYYLTRRGISKAALLESFAGNPRAAALTRELIKANVLTENIPQMKDFFFGLNNFTDTVTDESLFSDTEKFEEFRIASSTRDSVGKRTAGKPISLDDTPVADFLSKHKTTRKFDEKKQISRRLFSDVLGTFRARSDRNFTRFYPSAGGLYPIDIYIFVKERRVEGIPKGVYWYCPKDNCIVPTDAKEIDESLHYVTNRDIFSSSAISVFMVYHSESNIKKYGSLGYAYGLIDTGIMTQALYTACINRGLGACSIGDMDFDKLGHILNLNKGETVFHTVEIGLIP